jgi:hypothetical protein
MRKPPRLRKSPGIFDWSEKGIKNDSLLKVKNGNGIQRAAKKNRVGRR